MYNFNYLKPKSYEVIWKEFNSFLLAAEVNVNLYKVQYYKINVEILFKTVNFLNIK